MCCNCPWSLKSLQKKNTTRPVLHIKKLSSPSRQGLPKALVLLLNSTKMAVESEICFIYRFVLYTVYTYRYISMKPLN